MTFEQAWAAFCATQEHSDYEKRVALIFWDAGRASLDTDSESDDPRAAHQRSYAQAFDSRSVDP